jgi:hypothetical protein
VVGSPRSSGETLPRPRRWAADSDGGGGRATHVLAQGEGPPNPTARAARDGAGGRRRGRVPGGGKRGGRRGRR